MKKFDLKKAILENKATFHSSLNEGYDEFKRAEKGSKDVTAKDKGEEEVYGAGVKKGEEIEKKKMKVSELKAKIKEMVLSEMALDVDKMEDAPESEVDFLAELEGMLNEGSPMNDPRTAQIIQMLNDMEVDGETMEYILRQVGMDDQMANQLVLNKMELDSVNEMKTMMGSKFDEEGYEGSDDHFQDTIDESGLWPALMKFKDEGFSLEHVVGWIEANWYMINEAEANKFDTNKPARIAEFIKALDMLVDEYHAELYLSDDLFSAVEMVKKAANEAINLNEADEKAAEEEAAADVTVDDTETTDVETTAEVNPNVKAVQDSLTQAQAAAQKLGDKKLIDQIGNTITFFTRTHVVEKPGTVAEIEALKEMLLLQKKAGIISETQYKKKLEELETGTYKYYSKNELNDDFFKEFGNYVMFSAPVPPSDMEDEDEMSTSYFLVKPETADDNSKVDKFMELTLRRALRNKKVKIGTPNEKSGIATLSIPAIYVEK
jgi:hypothetical protein